jgi:predicted ATPase/DNA-binding CsgD family transcriptional regulator
MRIRQDGRVGVEYPAGLSQREAEVLEALAAHLSNAQIAGRLHISVRTVESHVSSLLRKLGASGRQQLAEMAPDVLLPAERQPPVMVGLPAIWTSFFGRANERNAIHEALQISRLVSLVGPGGVGKTRLAVEVARETAPSFRSGCLFANLVPVAEEFVVQAVATLLSVSEEPGRRLETAVFDHLADGRWLLVLDNCEHLATAAAAFTERVLAACPGVTVLATSQERLAVPGERAVPIQPLPVYGGRNEDRPAAVALFLDRSRALMPGFTASVADVAELCAQMDGMPLAIELAAARSASLGLDGLRSGLDDRLRLLAGGRGTDERHRSMRAVIGWSHDLLGAEERALFRRLSAFVGGFDLASAAWIVPDHPPAMLADLVGRLADKSLLVGPESNGGRWRMLETVRAYALERLAASGEEAVTRDRHLSWASDAAARLERQAAAGGEWRAGFDLVGDDLRAALAGSAGPDHTVHQLARSLGHLTYARRFLAEACGHYETAAASAPDPSRAAADLEAAASISLAAGRGDVAFALLRQAADRASAAGDDAARSITLACAVTVADRFPALFSDQVPHNQLQQLLQAADDAAPAGDVKVAASLAIARAWNAREEKESPDPRLAAEALAAARRSADPVLISGALDAAAAAAREAGELRRSYRLIQERGVLLDQLPRDDPRAGAEIVDTFHTAADGAVQTGDLPAALASARHGQGDSIAVGQPDLAVGIAVVPLVLQGAFDEAIDQATLMWDAWQRDRWASARWVMLACYAAVLAHGLRGDGPASRRWRDRISTLSSRADTAADQALAGFAAFTDARVAMHQGHLNQAARAADDLGIGSAPWFSIRHHQYDAYTLAVAVEADVLQRAPDAATRLAAAAPAAAENRWAAACLARATGRYHGDTSALRDAVAGWEGLQARYERAVTLLLIPGRETEGGRELQALGCPRPAV